MTVKIEGDVLGVTDETISYTDRTTKEPATFRLRQVHILSGMDALKVNLPDHVAAHDVPGRGVQVSVPVRAGVRRGEVQFTATEAPQEVTL